MLTPIVSSVSRELNHSRFCIPALGGGEKRGLIFKRMGWGLAEPVAIADVGQRRPRIGMSRNTLQINDVAACSHAVDSGGRRAGVAGRSQASGGGRTDSPGVSETCGFAHPGNGVIVAAT
jgi:hypothetical protein